MLMEATGPSEALVCIYHYMVLCPRKHWSSQSLL